MIKRSIAGHRRKLRKLAEIAGIAAKKKGGCRFPLPSSESGLLPVNAPVRQPAVVLPCHPEHLRHHLWGLPVGREPLRHRPAGRLCRSVDVLRAGPAFAAEDDPRQTPGGGRGCRGAVPEQCQTWWDSNKTHPKFNGSFLKIHKIVGAGSPPSKQRWLQSARGPWNLCRAS